METRFTNTPDHYNTPQFQEQRESINFAKVKAALKANSELMWRLNWMEETSGQPDVWGEEHGEFIFLCSSKESQEGRRDCVYSEKAEKKLKAKGMKFGGSVEEKLRTIGVSIVFEQAWRDMQKMGKFTPNTFDWVDSSDIVNIGMARYAGRCGDRLRVDRDFAGDHLPFRGRR